MNSCLYECHVMHARFTPRPHRFLYRLFLFALDLDELDSVARRVRGFSLNRAGAYAFHDRDYLPIHEPSHNPAPSPPPASVRQPPSASLKSRVHAFCAQHGVDASGGRVLLVTLPRVFGYRFSPVSFYFCYDRSGQPLAAIAEVTNTFREVKPYFLGPDSIRSATAGDGAFHVRVPKHFYVSPYSDVDVAFDFTLRAPASALAVQIDDYVGRERTLTSTLTGTRHALTSTRLAWFTLKYPLITLRVITLIHWHALRLWLKRVPWFAKAARSADQRDLYRPHHSLQLSDPA